MITITTSNSRSVKPLILLFATNFLRSQALRRRTRTRPNMENPVSNKTKDDGSGMSNTWAIRQT